MWGFSLLRAAVLKTLDKWWHCSVWRHDTWKIFLKGGVVAKWVNWGKAQLQEKKEMFQIKKQHRGDFFLSVPLPGWRRRARIKIHQRSLNGNSVNEDWRGMRGLDDCISKSQMELAEGMVWEELSFSKWRWPFGEWEAKFEYCWGQSICEIIKEMKVFSFWLIWFLS